MVDNRRRMSSHGSMQGSKGIAPKTAESAMSDAQYQILATRRQAYDSMMWQTPVIGLTGQAFLFTIALGAGTTSAARLISAFLALTSAISSLQLMAKHRASEVADSKELERQEISMRLAPIHARRDAAVTSDNKFKAWTIRRSSYTVWMFCLGSFGIAAAFVIAITILGIGWLR